MIDIINIYFISSVLALSIVILIYRDYLYQKKLIISENKYRTLIENVKHTYFFYRYNKDGIFTYVSNSVYDILGYETNEFLCHYNRYLTNNQINKLMNKYFYNAKQGIPQSSYNIEIYHKDGSKHWLELTETAEFSKDGTFISIDGIAKDITENIRVNNLIANSKTILFYWEAKENWPVSYVSNNISIFGYNPQDFLSGKIHFSSIIHPDDIKDITKEVECFTEECIDTFVQVYRIFDNDGNIRWIDDRTTIERNLKGEATFYLGTILDITEQKEAEMQLIYQAKHDELTNLPNKTLLLDRIQNSITKSKNSNFKFGIIFIDFDRFKEVNDSMGHKFGDKIIIEASERFKNCMTNINTLSRLGGDEFVILTDRIEESSTILNIIQTLKKVMKKSFIINEQQVYITLSIGVSIYPKDGDTAGTLLKNSDAAMFQAKDDGRNTYRFYTEEMTSKALDHIVMETNIRKGLKEDEFILHYQPQVDAITGKLVGVEALIRWQHPIMGLISPYKFIPLAERTGLIIPLDRWVMKTAMKQMVKWYEMGFNAGVLSINLSIQQLEEDDFLVMFDELIKSVGIKPEWVELEITEGQLMKNPKKSIEILTKISKRGIKLAIDDFGTGYSSLAYLKNFPINKLKIDRSFVKDIPNDKDDMEITKSIISLSKNLNLSVIAEGVETLAQKDFLVKNGCKYIQGYIYAKPMDSEDIENLWLKHQ